MYKDNQLNQIKKEYEIILNDENLSLFNRNIMLGNLMTKMESLYHIPCINNEGFNQSNREIMTLYLMISNSRSVDEKIVYLDNKFRKIKNELSDSYSELTNIKHEFVDTLLQIKYLKFIKSKQVIPVSLKKFMNQMNECYNLSINCDDKNHIINIIIYSLDKYDDYHTIGVINSFSSIIDYFGISVNTIEWHITMSVFHEELAKELYRNYTLKY